MIRTLFQAPASIDWQHLREQISLVCSDLVAVNDVSGQVAVYCSSSPSQQEIADIGAVVAAHDPSSMPFPPLDPIGALATLLVVLELVPLADASNAIHEEPEHLVAEAQAWSIG
jgi:hypothetical protein